MNRSAVLGVAAAALLAGCASGPRVTPAVGGRVDQNAGVGAVVYALPTTILDARLSLTVETLKPGALPIPDARCGGAEQALCDRERAFNFKAAAPDGDGSVFKSGTCWVSLGDATEVSPLAVPDPDQVYFVEIDPRWYEKLEVSLEWSDGGLPVKSGFSASSAVPGLLEKLLPQLSGELFEFRVSTTSTSAASVKDEEMLRQRSATIAELEKIAARRTQLLYGAGSVSGVGAILGELKEREAVLRRRYEGQVIKEAGTASVRFSNIGIVPGSDGTGSVTDEAVISNPCADAKPEKLTIKALITPEPDSIRVTSHARRIAPPDPDDAGFRYRVPVRSTVVLQGAAGTSLLAKTFSIDIAQFGPIGVLPRRLGWRGGAVAVTLSPTSGALRGLNVSSGESAGAQIIGVISTEATRDREMAELERQAKELELREKIRNLTNPAPAE